MKVINGNQYLLEYGIKGDLSILRAHQADKYGNLRFRLSSRNFNPLVAQAGDITIVEVEEFVDKIDPDDVHLPGIYVDFLLKAEKEKQIEKIKIFNEQSSESPEKIKIAIRLCEEFKDRMIINLGIGLPTLALQYNKNKNVIFQSENGVVGMGPYPKKEKIDPDLINAGKETISLVEGASIVDSNQSFSMIRGGHINITVLGGMEVSSNGDLANWIIPNKTVKGMGGAMDLVSSSTTNVIVAMEHTSKSGKAKILQNCTLPLTGKACVNRIITELAVFDVLPSTGLNLIQHSKETSIEEIKAKTECNFTISKKLLAPF